LAQDVRRFKSENEQLHLENKALEDSLKVLADKVEELTINLDIKSSKSQPQPQQTPVASIFSKLADSYVTRNPEQQQVLDQTLRSKFPELPTTEIVYEWFNCNGGFLYVTSSYVAFDSLVSPTQRESYKIIEVVSVNMSVVSSWVPIPTLEIRLLDGGVKIYRGIPHKKEAATALKTRAKNAKHVIFVYENGLRVKDASEEV